MPITAPDPNGPFDHARSGRLGTPDTSLVRDPGIFWLRLSGWLFLLLLLATATAFVLGARLPATQVAAVTTTLPAPAPRIWQLLTDIPNRTTWPSAGLDGQILPGNAANKRSLPCWTELHGHFAVPLCITSSVPPTRLTVAISDPRLPFQGSWTFDLQAVSSSSTRLTITESQQIQNCLWRFAMHYGRGDHATLDGLASDLRSAAARP